MTIGSKVVASSPVAGSLGTIVPESKVSDFNQEVRFRQVIPDHTVATFSQSVGEIIPDKYVAKFKQRVVTAGTVIQDAPYQTIFIEIGDELLDCRKPHNNINITHAEGQQSTAKFTVYYETGSLINIPSFYGKSVTVYSLSDHLDPESDIITLFTGVVDRADHSLREESIIFDCVDLRDEKLSEEDPKHIQTITGAKYSTTTQREGVEGLEYITELMKTVDGSIFYQKDGSLSYYQWTSTGTPVITFLGDIEYDSVRTEFQPRSTVINSIEINLDYIYQGLRTATTDVFAYKPRAYENAFYSTTDYKAFNRQDLLSTLNSINDWEVTSAQFLPLERAWERGETFPGIILDLIWNDFGRATYCQGIDATLVRRIAQPIRESYQMLVQCPQSIDAYGKEIFGSVKTYTLQVDYDGSYWEDDFRQGSLPTTSSTFDENTQQEVAISTYQAEQTKADNLRNELANAFDCAYLIAKKELLASHRRNYVYFDKYSFIGDQEIGDIIEVDSDELKVTGQLVGLEYSFQNTEYITSYKIAVNYLDTLVSAPAENYTRPTAPTKPSTEFTVTSYAEYNDETRVFDIRVGDINEQYTDEIVQEVDVPVYNVPIEDVDIILKNGWS